MERWQGRVALVTGAGSGQGAAVTRRLVAAGMKVAAADIHADSVKALADELKGQPGAVTPFKCDITKDQEVLQMFATIKSKMGGVDVCINSAGVIFDHGLLDGPTEEWRKMNDVNIVGLSLCTREAVASMFERKVDDGQIIHISSMTGHNVNPNPSFHYYAATKFAVTALTEGLRQELRAKKSHIRVAQISPGLVNTDFWLRHTNDLGQTKEMMKAFHSLDADDIARSIVHILSQPPHVQIHDVLIRGTEQQF